MSKIKFEVYPFGPLSTNGILVMDPNTKKAAIIDAPLGSVDFFLEKAKSLSITIEKILLTHSHWDHIGDVAELKEILGVPVYVHERDVGNLKNPGSDKIPLFCAIQGIAPDYLLADGQKLQVGELEFQVIHTPGHSPGGVCFYVEKEGEKVLFAGDTLFRGTMGNLNLPTANAKDMWQSLKKLAALPSDTRVIPGHGGGTTIGAEKWMAHAEERFLIYS